MECREFRDLLLLLREDLQDKDIPHRTKVRETVITAWKSWFTILKREFAVVLTNQFWSSVVTSLFFRMQLGKSALLPISGLTATVAVTSP